MPFIGTQPTRGAYLKCDAITTSATASYTLQVNGGSVNPASANNMLVSLNGVIQAPQDAYTVTGSTITFDSALTSSDVIDFILILGNTDPIGTPADGTITTNKLQNNSVTNAKLATGAGGKILKFQKVTFTAEFQTQNDSFTDITNATLSFTPTASDSTLRITSMLHIYLGQGSSATVGGAFQIVHDGTALETPNNQQYYKSAGSGTAIFQLPHYFTSYVSAGSTSARTIKAQGRCYAGSNAAEFLVNKGSAYTSHIEVLEIGV